MDREKIIKELTNLPMTVYGGFYQLRITHDLRNKVIALLKEQEEQKQKWLEQIADAQIAVCRTGDETEEGTAKRNGLWNGLQMARDILINGR